MANTQVGTPLSAQSAGDCQTQVCDGRGGVTSTPNDSDLPDDGNPCTADACNNGVPLHTPVSMGASCGADGGMVCNATGQCVGCLQATDCPGKDTDCSFRTCDSSGTCGFGATAFGTPTQTQTAGDCQQSVCAGDGGVISVALDSDLPDDSNPCTADSCAGGVPSHAALDAGAACGSGMLCDGAGQCVGCLSPLDCPGTDSDCAQRTCVNFTCGTAFATDGTPTSTQAPGNCQRQECDGRGHTVSRADNSDVPPNPGDCAVGACNNGAPTSVAVDAGTACAQNGGTVCNGSGACVQCLGPNDCPGGDGDCASRTCTNGVCGFSFSPVGQPLGTQTPGDCRQAQCDGDGGTLSVVGDSDLPVDGNTCTADVCTNGVPSHPATNAGGACGADGGMLCNNNGQCVGCLTVADCPGTDTECSTRICDSSGTCGFANTPANSPTAAQTAGDCQVRVCDGDGGVTSVPANADLPDDANPCTNDLCTNGVASHTSVMAGTSCGGGMLCDGSGKCVGCLQPADCPATGSECIFATCINNTCGTGFVVDGTPVSTQTAGDCQRRECDGSGHIVSRADNTDVPADDGNPCTGEACSAGVPGHPPLPSGTACSQGGTVCNGAGACVQCVTPSNCGTDTACRTYTCVGGACGAANAPAGTMAANPTPGDCHTDQCDGNGGITTNAVDNTDVPADDSNQCTGETCVAGTPQHPNKPQGTACAQNGGVECNGSGTCVQCLVNSDCGTDTACQAHVCSSGFCSTENAPGGTVVANPTSGDCRSNQCDGSGNTISGAVDDTDLPVDGNPCTSDVCTNGVASNPAVPLGTPCGSGMVCDASGRCVGCLQASDCPATGNECLVAVCNSGSCGTAPVTAGTATSSQTPGDCQKNVCDGAGNIVSTADNTDVPTDDGNPCTSEVCTAGVASHPAVADGTACNQSGGTLCHSGACVAQPVVVSTTPADGASAVATTTVAVTFNTAMDPSTLTAQTSAGACTGSIQVSLNNFASCIAISASAPAMSGNNTVATLTPQPGLLVNRTYKVRVTTAATSAAGVALSSQFTQPNGFTTTSPNLCDSSVVISQVYGGGNATSGSPTYKCDFIELHNRGTTTVSLAGWSVQYHSATGTGNWVATALSGSVAPGGYYLVQEKCGSVGGTLPTADLVPSVSQDMSASNGMVLLASTTTAYPNGCPTDSNVKDLVGYGSTPTCFEGARTGTALSTTTSAQRISNGCVDSNNNGSDFAVVTNPVARNSASTAVPCACGVQNESGAALEADYCTVQYPLSLSAQTGTTVATVYGRLYESGVTGGGSANANVRAQLGYGPLTANPEYSSSWSWTNATYNSSCSGCGSNDEYQATFTAPATGTYGYAYRFSLDQGVSWTYCDQDANDFGAGSNPNLTFELADVPVMTVTP